MCNVNICLQNFNNKNWKSISHVNYVYTYFVNCVHVLVACQLSLNSSTDSLFIPTLTRHAQCTDITLCKKKFAIMVEATLTSELVFKLSYPIRMYSSACYSSKFLWALSVWHPLVCCTCNFHSQNTAAVNHKHAELCFILGIQHLNLFFPKLSLNFLKYCSLVHLCIMKQCLICEDSVDEKATCMH